MTASECTPLGASASPLLTHNAKMWKANDEEKAASAASRVQVNQLEAELAARRSSYLYSRVRRAVDARAVRRVRANRHVARLERRLRG